MYLDKQMPAAGVHAPCVKQRHDPPLGAGVPTGPKTPQQTLGQEGACPESLDSLAVPAP